MFTFKLRRGTAAQWVAVNPILKDGEPGLETDTRTFKVGDGVKTWLQLPVYLPDYLSEAALGAYINDAVITASPITQEELDWVADQVILELDLPDLTLLWENAKA